MCLPVRCGCTVSPVTAPRSRRRCWPPPDTAWWPSTTTTTPPPPRDWTSRPPRRYLGEPRPAPVRNGELAMMALTVPGRPGRGRARLARRRWLHPDGPTAGLRGRYGCQTRHRHLTGRNRQCRRRYRACAGRAGAVRTAALFGVAGMAGAYAEGRLTHLIPGTVLMIAFAAATAAAAIACCAATRTLTQRPNVDNCRRVDGIDDRRRCTVGGRTSRTGSRA